MTRLTRAGTEPGSGSALLRRIVERPELVAAVDKLSAPVLGQLIARVGLEDAGELVAVATTQQLERVWDRDLWTRFEHGGPERFDPGRFGLWLSVMLEAGEEHTVTRLCELPVDLLTLAVHRTLRVVDRRAWLALMAELDDADDDSGSSTEWEDLLLIARDEDAWEPVSTALFALDAEHHDLLRRVLERCRDMDEQLFELELEEDQLYTALTGADALESDVQAERDTRQAAAGYISGADAQSFMRTARSPHWAAMLRDGRSPTARAYFRELEGPQAEEQPAAEPDASAGADDVGSSAERAALFALLELLSVSGVPGARGPALAALTAHASDSSAEVVAAPEGDAEPRVDRHDKETRDARTDSLLQAALRLLEREQATTWSERMEELGLISNAVLSACTLDARAFEPREALSAGAALCSLGLELALSPARQNPRAAAELLQRVHAEPLFCAASERTYRELTLPARRALVRRCARRAPGLQTALEEALASDELGQLPEGIDHELLRLDLDRFLALRGLAESVPRLAGTLSRLHGAQPIAGFVTTRAQLSAAKRLLRGFAR